MSADADTSDLGAWALAKVGRALDLYTDNTLNQPHDIAPDGYVRGTDGRLYATSTLPQASQPSAQGKPTAGVLVVALGVAVVGALLLAG